MLSFFRRLFGKRREIEEVLSAKENASKRACNHGGPRRNLKMTILDVECEIEKSGMCGACTETYLNTVCTLCASCGRPIFPGDPVGQAWVDAPHPHTHLTFDCCDTGGLYCGQWGEGRLITLHELDPKKYPAGASSMMDAAMQTGKPVVQNFR